jgi:NAD kinase
VSRYSERRIRLVTRKTRLDDLIARHNTVDQARFAIQSRGGNFADIESEHIQFGEVKSQVQKLLDAHGRLELIPREYVPNYIFGPDDLVVCLGQDGLVANVLKYLPTQVVVGVNPDVQRWDGVLLPFDFSKLQSLIKKVVDDKLVKKEVKLAEAAFNDGQILRAVNDLFIGASSHISARYAINFKSVVEKQSSSGIIVSTGLGSTGWYSSLVTGARRWAEDHSVQVEVFAQSWDMSSNELRFTVREPFVSHTTGADLVSGVLVEDDKLTIESNMGERGVVFSDGVEADSVEFNAGSIVHIGLSQQSGWLLKP